MVEKAKSGHPGGAMGGADFINILYSEFLNYDPDKLDYPFRDRFFLDPGHMSPMLYSVLALAGIMPAEELQHHRVALRKESVDRNRLHCLSGLAAQVALRKESVDRNFSRVISLPFSCMSQFSCSSVMPGILFFTSSRFMVETPFCG